MAVGLYSSESLRIHFQAVRGIWWWDPAPLLVASPRGGSSISMTWPLPAPRIRDPTDQDGGRGAFYDLRLAVTYCHFCCVPFVTPVRPNSMWEGPTKGVGRLGSPVFPPAPTMHDLPTCKSNSPLPGPSKNISLKSGISSSKANAVVDKARLV